MTEKRMRCLLMTFCGALVFTTLGCAQPTRTNSIRNGFDTATTFAVAPVLNFSGDFDLDPIQAADLLASELTQVEGITVLPVNRVVAALASTGKSQIESPEHAVRIAKAIGADAIVVAGITEYDAYTPIVGLALQVYAVETSTDPMDFNAVEFSRQWQPVSHGAASTTTIRPLGQIQHVYNAAHSQTVEAVRQYAAPRTQAEHAYGWRQYLKVQRLYLRFCWNDAVRQLMQQQHWNNTRLVADLEMESR